MQDLKAKADLMERRLVAAERLIAGLGSEQQRWSADIQTLEAARERLVGDCLLASSFLSYTGAAPGLGRSWATGRLGQHGCCMCEHDDGCVSAPSAVESVL